VQNKVRIHFFSFVFPLKTRQNVVFFILSLNVHLSWEKVGSIFLGWVSHELIGFNNFFCNLTPPFLSRYKSKTPTFLAYFTNTIKRLKSHRSHVQQVTVVFSFNQICIYTKQKRTALCISVNRSKNCVQGQNKNRNDI
jgi:hypothetical protein